MRIKTIYIDQTKITIHDDSLLQDEQQIELIREQLNKIALRILKKHTTQVHLKNPVPTWFFHFFISNNARANELAHLEMIGAIVHQLTRNLSEDEIKKSGFDTYFVDHTAGVYPASAAGVRYTDAYMKSKGDMITDLHEDLAAEQKARTTYDNILRLVDDPDVRDPIKFLREREIVHYQRFGEGLRLATDKMNSKNFYACNPSFDKHCR